MYTDPAVCDCSVDLCWYYSRVDNVHGVHSV